MDSRRHEQAQPTDAHDSRSAASVIRTELALVMHWWGWSPRVGLLRFCLVLERQAWVRSSGRTSQRRPHAWTAKWSTGLDANGKRRPDARKLRLDNGMAGLRSAVTEPTAKRRDAR